MINEAPSWGGPWTSQRVDVSLHRHFRVWVEAAWVDTDGTVFGWYHHEPSGICPGDKLTTPKIGAVVSYDGGRTIIDLGIVLESGEAPNCSAKNGFFAGGHGDFSVILDRDGEYFYFLFTNYGGGQEEQGIVIARMAFEDRHHPVGSVRKYYQGEWDEPGIGGRMTPIYAVGQAWEAEDADSFWGPAIHWNTQLQQYVMVMNRSCCSPNWPMEGVYIAYSMDLSNPATWGRANKILDGREAGGYYPQVVGMSPGETDSLVGAKARLFVQGVSRWEISFPVLPVEDEEPGSGDEISPVMPVDPFTRKK